MTRTRTQKVRTMLIAPSVALMVVLSGCASPFSPVTPAPVKTSAPTVAPVTEFADLDAYYAQDIAWEKCESGFECATVKAPLDWDDPSRSSIDLAIIRAKATKEAMGSLLINPGGPGGSGYDFVSNSLSFAVDAKLRANYDIIGFDPRGVNKSSAVSCYDDPAEMDHFLFDSPEDAGDPGSDKWFDASKVFNDEFAQACLKHTGELLGYVDTVSAARDMDLLRAVLGDEKLNFLGYSYGTFLGATYADLYPENTGRIVLDGAIDPATTEFDVTITQAVGFEKALRSYISFCQETSYCPFKGTVDQAMSKISALMDTLDESPIRASDGRYLGSSAMFYAIITPLYSEDSWPVLTDVFSDAFDGYADYALQIADFYFGRTFDGTYEDNSTEAGAAINCLDYKSTSSREQLRAEAVELAKAAPLFGPQMSYGDSCSSWPFQSTRERVAIEAKGSGPILVLGTTGDPATPYKWSVALADQLENGQLVTRRGEGHTAYNKANSCIDNVVDDYFLKGTVPSKDPNC